MMDQQQATIEFVSSRLESLRKMMSAEVDSTPAISPIVSTIPDLLSSPSPVVHSGYNTPSRGSSFMGSPSPSAASNEALKRLDTSKYVKRLSSFMRCDEECFLMATLLVERLASRRTAAINAGQLIVVADPSDPTAGHSLRSAGCHSPSPPPQPFGGRTPIVLSPTPESGNNNSHHHHLVQENSLEEDFEIDSFADLQRKLEILRLFGKDKAQLFSAYLACLVIAIKLTCDDFQTNAHYAQIGGLHAAVLCDWETKVLDALDYDIVITAEDFRREAAPLFNQPDEEETTSLPSTPPQIAVAATTGSQPIPLSSTSPTTSSSFKQKKSSVFGTATFISATASGTSIDTTVSSTTAHTTHGLSEDDDKDEEDAPSTPAASNSSIVV